jgi:hypothetical protein
MVDGFKLFVDEGSAIFGKLHFLLSILGPCEIDDSFLPKIASHSYCIMIGAAYKNDEFLLLITILDQPRGAKNRHDISRNTGVMTYILNGLVKFTTSTYQPYSTFRILFGLCIYLTISSVRILLFIINLLLVAPGTSVMKSFLKWPTFGIDVRTDSGLSLINLHFTSEEEVRMSLPCVIFNSSKWAVIFDISIIINIFLKSDIFQASASKMKISVKADSAIPTLNQLIEELAALRSLNGGQGLQEKKLFERNQPYVLQSYSCTISGDLLDITVNETMLRASIYLKGKYLAEKYFDNRHYENNLILWSAKSISVKFCRFQLHGISDGPRCVAMDVSLVITNTLSSHTHPKNSNSNSLQSHGDEGQRNDYCTRVEHTCKQLEFHSNVLAEHRILFSHLSATYHYCYGMDCKERNISGLGPQVTYNVHIQCKKVEIDTVDGSSYGMIEKGCLSALKCFALLSRTMFGVRHEKCSCSFLIDEFSLQLLFRTSRKSRTSLPSASLMSDRVRTAPVTIDDINPCLADTADPVTDNCGLSNRKKRKSAIERVATITTTAAETDRDTDKTPNHNHNKVPTPRNDLQRFTSTVFLSNVSGSMCKASTTLSACDLAQYVSEEGSSRMFELCSSLGTEASTENVLLSCSD